MSMFSRRSLAVCTAVAWALGAPSAAYAQANYSFNMPAQDLGRALRTVARRTGANVVFDPASVRGRRAAALSGSFSASQAMERLLAGSGLEAHLTSGGSWVVSSSGEPGAGSAAAENEVAEQPIVVTGTRIRGVGASAGTYVRTINRQEIDRAGYGSVHEYIETIPQHFGGGAIEDVVGGSFENFSRATSVNLRGLGNSATLTLLNGRRLPTAGLNGDFQDISSIPTAALARIEILADGASAIYGADAVAGVVNVILREDYEGAETRVRYGSVTQGSMDEVTVGQTFGTRWATGNILLSYEFYDRDALPASERRLAASADLRPFGGRSFLVTQSNPGNIYDLSTFQPSIPIPRGQNGRSLQPGSFAAGPLNLGDPAEDRDIFPQQRRHNLFFNLNQSLGPIKLFAQGMYANRRFASAGGHQRTTLFVPATNAFFVDPFGGTSPFLLIDYDLARDIGPGFSSGEVNSYAGAAGATVPIAGDWQLRFHAAYGRETTHSEAQFVDSAALDLALADSNPATAFNPFADGSSTSPATLARIEGIQTSNTRSRVLNLNAIADGTIFHLPGGPAKLAFGADYRVERFGDSSQDLGSVTVAQRLSDGRRKVLAGFAELYLPVVSEANAIPGIQALTVSAAIRHDHYGDDRRVRNGVSSLRPVGSTTNPKIGVTWAPIRDLRVRGTFGTSFRAPSLPTAGAQAAAFVFGLADPASPFGFTQTLFRTGTNPALTNETATNWTAGFDWTPRGVPGLDLGATYYNIRFRNRITALSNPASILFDAKRFAALIIRNPTQAQLNAVCGTPEYRGSPAQCTAAQIGAIVDGRTNNVGNTNVEGIDIRVRYGSEVRGIGRLDLTIDASYLIKFEEAIGAGATPFETLNTLGNPVDLHMRNSLGWSNGRGLSATLFMNYYDGYRNSTSTLAWRSTPGRPSISISASTPPLLGCLACSPTPRST